MRKDENFDVPLFYDDGNDDTDDLYATPLEDLRLEDPDPEQDQDAGSEEYTEDGTEYSSEDDEEEDYDDEYDEQYGEAYRDFLPQAQKSKGKGTLVLISLAALGLCAAFFLASAACQVHDNDMLAEQIDAISFEMPQVEGPPKPTASVEDILTQPIQLEMPSTDLPDKAAKNIRAKEEKKKTSTLHEEDYKVYTDAASHFLIADQLEKTFGTLYCDAWDMQVNLAYSNSQKFLDASDTACVLTPEIKNLPGVGETAGAAVILDYNDQAFSALQSAKPGDRLYIKTVYGEFIYAVSKTQLGMASKNGQSIILDNNENLMDYCTSGKFKGIVLCTNYPFDSQEDTNYRYVVFARLIDGTSMTL